MRRLDSPQDFSAGPMQTNRFQMLSIAYGREKYLVTHNHRRRMPDRQLSLPEHMSLRPNIRRQRPLWHRPPTRIRPAKLRPVSGRCQRRQAKAQNERQSKNGVHERVGWLWRENTELNLSRAD